MRGKRFDAGGGRGDRGGRRALGRRWWPRRSGAGWRDRCSPAFRGWSARRRSRTSAPTVRRSPRRSAPCGCSNGDRRTRRARAPRTCGFGYRDSAFKRDPGRFVVLAVTFALRPGAAPALRYRELADAPGRRPSTHAGRGPRDRARAARRKSMLVIVGRSQPAQRRLVLHESRLSRRRGGRRWRRAPAPTTALGCRAGRRRRRPVKLSAGWLIERAGIRKGHRRGAVGVSSAHALALVHHGGGSTAALLALAREVPPRCKLVSASRWSRTELPRDGLEPHDRLSILTASAEGA